MKNRLPEISVVNPVTQYLIYHQSRSRITEAKTDGKNLTLLPINEKQEKSGREKERERGKRAKAKEAEHKQYIYVTVNW